MSFRAQEVVDSAGVELDRLALALPNVDPRSVKVRRASRWFMALWAKGITAVAMPWGIYLHPDRFAASQVDLGPLIVHELTHIDQWRRLGPLGWSRSYVGDYLRGRRSGLSHNEAYRAIGLEREARDVARRICG